MISFEQDLDECGWRIGGEEERSFENDWSMQHKQSVQRGGPEGDVHVTFSLKESRGSLTG